MRFITAAALVHELSEGGDRYTTALVLAKRHPEAVVVFTGGSGALRDALGTEKSESELAQPVPVTDGPRRPGDCTKLVSGSLRAKTELGWSADRSNLKQMITDAWRWHQSGGYTK